jgi:hypothetical protein
MRLYSMNSIGHRKYQNNVQKNSSNQITAKTHINHHPPQDLPFLHDHCLHHLSLDMGILLDVGMFLGEALHRWGVEVYVDLDSHSSGEGVGKAAVHATQALVGLLIHHLQNNLVHAIQDRMDNIHQKDKAVESKDLHRSHHMGNTINPQVVLH